MQSLDQALRDYLRTANLNEARIAVGCSAGLDSMVLLRLLIANHPLHLITCLHLDHSLRLDSHIAKDFLEGFCSENQISFISETLVSGSIDKDENSAREARYSFFERICSVNSIQYLFLAHTANDQAETLLFRLFRGTSTWGLQGIPLTRQIGDLEIHRPLLSLTREQLLEYNDGRAWVEDSSNVDLKFARNRIRNQIIPEALQINSQVVSNLNKLSNIVIEEQELLAQLVGSANDSLGALPWDLNQFRQIPRAIQRKILEETFTSNIDFVNDFLMAIELGGFHKINFEKNKFFTIRARKIQLETC